MFKDENVQNFLNLFNELHQVIAARLRDDSEKNFGNLLKKAHRDRVITHYERQLNFYKDVRNLLTHDRLPSQKNILLPSDELLQDLISVKNTIEHPKKIGELFRTDVQAFNTNDTLGKILPNIRKNKISQFPLFAGKRLVGIITENGITNYLARHSEQDLSAIKEIPAVDIIASDERRKNYAVVAENKSIYEIEELFYHQIASGHGSFILLIAKNGKKNKPTPKDLIGVITPWDMPKLLRNK